MKQIDSIAKISRPLGFLVVMATCLLLAETGSIAGAEGPTVLLQPAATTVSGCGTTSVDIRLQDVTNAYGADIMAWFDPAILQAQDDLPGAPGTQITPLGGFMSPSFVIQRAAYNVVAPSDPPWLSPGAIWYVFTQLAPDAPKTGSGAIARVTFRGVSAGTSSLIITYAKVSDVNAAGVFPARIHSTLEVVPPVAPVLEANRVDSTTVRLTWPATTGTYRLYRSTDPLFVVYEPAWQYGTMTSFDDVTALGTVGEEYFYAIGSECPNGLRSEMSNQVGAWDYQLVTN